MTADELRASLRDRSGALWVRDDGATAIVVSVRGGTVYYRRDVDSEMLRCSQDAFVRRYTRAVDA